MAPSARAHRRTSGVRIALSAIALGAVCACGDATSNTLADAGVADAAVGDSGLGDVGAGPRPSPARAAFVPEFYGVGTRWYDYDEVTHAISPKPEHYVVRWDDWAARVRVLSYYNVDGESGYFTLSVASWDGGAWGSPSTLELQDSVKDAPVCVDLQSAAAVDCSAPHHLLLRTDRRVVPAAGFAVAEPGIFVTAHRFDGEDVAVWSVDPDAAFDPFAASVSAAVPSAFRESEAGVLRDLTGDSAWTVIQATASFRVCAWQAESTSDALTVRSRCAPLSSTASSQSLLTDATEHTLTFPPPTSTETLTLAFDADGAPVEVARDDAFAVGHWGDNTAFDLLVERSAAGLVYLAGPGALVHVRDPADHGDAVLTLPSALWD